MSTRSGKRIHNDDITNEADMVLMSERKTRSKRVVDNGDDQVVISKPKKRQNYVSYPSEESAGGNSEVETQSKPTRALRRNTLREQNAAVEEVEVTDVKKQARQTRRTKKHSETATEELLPSPHSEEVIEVVTITNGKLKNKKNKKKATKITEQVEVINKENSSKVNKKKKNKKKKNSRTNSLVDENIMSKTNESHTSMDSFHSAAGSPVDADGDCTSPKESGTLLIDDNAHQGKNKKKSSLKNISHDLNSTAKLAVDIDMVLKSTFNKETESTNEIESNKRKSSLKNATFEKEKPQDATEKLNTTFEKEPTIGTQKSSNKRKRISDVLYSTENTTSPAPKKSSPILNKHTSNGILNTTFEKDDINESVSKKPRKSNIIEQIKGLFSKNDSPRKSLRISETAAPNGMFDLSPKPDEIKQKPLDITLDKQNKLNSTFDKESKQLNSTFDKESKQLNSTFDKESKLNSTFDKESKLDSTFEKIEQKPASNKSSLISSDLTGSSLNVTLDKSEEGSHFSITDDDSKTENILNATPVLIESSMEDSKVLESSMKENKTPEPKPATTPLKREGTFTKDESEVVTTPKQTPGKRQTLPAAGCTPYHSNNKGPKKSVLNLTHSIEKPGRLSSAAELPRATRVMFCSPVNNPAVVMHQKTKVIKSSLKGSNKSFVHEDSGPAPTPTPGSRKRSLSQAAAGVAAKRSRVAPPRARTASAAAKLSTSTTPAKPLTPAPKSEVKATKLPNFAALHARRFERMESLDECQERKARRAKVLLHPTGSLDIIEKSSPRDFNEMSVRRLVVEQHKPHKAHYSTPAKPATPAKPPKPPKLPTLDTLQRGYTRFGFKMDCAVNPFTVPIKPVEKPKEIKPKPVNKKPQPSSTGATSLRRAVAKQTIMREKSFSGTGKRDESRKESRTIIKGVRTNRRFELQMMSRNINC